MRTCVRTAGIAVLSLAALLAQSQEQRAEYPVRGEISWVPPGAGVLTVELTGNQAGPGQTATVGPDGSFELRSVSVGWHEIRVLTAGGATLHQETVYINGSNQLLTINLPDHPNAARSADPTVSVQQLAHKVPPQAKKAFEKGVQVGAKGNHQQAEELYRQAVSIDPQFADGFNALAAEEANAGDLKSAAEDFQKAIDIDPQHNLALGNLSIVLAKLRRYGEAASVARRALQVVPNSGTVHFVLAISLLFDKGDSDEVLEHLERSASDVPAAHLVAARLLAQRGKRPEAIQHLEDFLRVAPADDKDRDRAQAMLASLRP
jgi:tetratricopeptide (TPR) repeat protein